MIEELLFNEDLDAQLLTYYCYRKRKALREEREKYKDCEETPPTVKYTNCAVMAPSAFVSLPYITCSKKSKKFLYESINPMNVV